MPKETAFQQLADLLFKPLSNELRNGNDIPLDPVTDVPIGFK